MARRTVALTLEIEQRLRGIQAALLVKFQRDVSFTQVVNYVLGVALAKAETTGSPLSPTELDEAKVLTKASGAELAGLFDPVAS